MRDFQTKSNVGALPDSNSATKYGGAEATALRTEAKNTVSRAGLTLAPQDGTGEDTTQAAQAMLINGVAASTFQSGGTANAITLTPVTGATGLVLPPDYTTLDGAQISFFAGFNNTGATTVSLGQTGGAQFGVKKVLDEAGADLVGGEIVAGSRTDFIYDASADGGSGAAILRAGVAATPDSFASQLLHIQDQKPDSTQGGTFTSGAWRTRVLNTVILNEIAGASLSANQITLPAGDYYVEAIGPGFGQLDGFRHQLTDTTAEFTILGLNAYSNSGHAANGLVNGRFTLTATRLVEFQGRCTTTVANNGFGSNDTMTIGVETYSEVKIWKVG